MDKKGNLKMHERTNELFDEIIMSKKRAVLKKLKLTRILILIDIYVYLA
jgi:hypothetical protein